jgi:hypothetical protein
MTQSLAHIPPTRTILQLIPTTSSSRFHVVRLQKTISSPDRHDKRDYTGRQSISHPAWHQITYILPCRIPAQIDTFPTHALYYASCPLRDNCIFRTFQLTIYVFSLKIKLYGHHWTNKPCEILRPALLGLSHKKQPAFS